MGKCMVFETFADVKSLKRDTQNGLMTMSGVFGVCGVRNNNGRVYEKSNYGKMVQRIKERIERDGAIPGTLEHEQTMNVSLENISHKVVDISINEEGVVSGTIQLLNTPKGKIAQAIVEGGLPLFVSSRGSGSIDKAGNVTLESIKTYDLVSDAGFSQARMHLNESHVCESISDNIFVIHENSTEETPLNENNDDEMNKELLERFEALENEVKMLREENETLKEQVEEAIDAKIDIKKLAEGIQKWVLEDYSGRLEKWIKEDYSDQMAARALNESKKMFVKDAAPLVQKWCFEDFAPQLSRWISEEYSPQVENWVMNQVAPGLQSWMVEHFSPEIECWLNESYAKNVQDMISEGLKDTKAGQLKSITDTLSLLESLKTEPLKPVYGTRTITESTTEEPLYIAQMPEDSRVKWNMASQEIKESIQRRAMLFDFNNEGAIERFWESVKWEAIKPANVYEGLETITDERERAIRAGFRRKRQNF